MCSLSQQDGKLPFVPGDEDMILGVSKYGVKVASLDQCVSRETTACNGSSHVEKLILVLIVARFSERAASPPALPDRAHAVLR